MKPTEAIRALAFMANPDELTSNDCSRCDFESGFGSHISRVFSRVFSKRKQAVDTRNTSSTQTDFKLSSSSINMAPSSSKEDNASQNNSECSDKGVCFGTVEVRKYPITIGNNPSVSRGVPHTIEWDHLKDETETHHIDEYERYRPTDERKHGDDLILDGITRAKMLKNLGYTKEELLEGIRKVNEEKILNSCTIMNRSKKTRNSKIA